MYVANNSDINREILMKKNDRINQPIGCELFFPVVTYNEYIHGLFIKSHISRNLGHRKRKRQTNKENDAGDCEKGGFLKAILYYRL